MANEIYANARAKSLEKNLLNSERISRMLDSTNALDAIKILNEVGFGDGAQLESVVEFEKLINVENKKFRDFLCEQGALTSVADFFLLKNDYHNAEALVKMKYLKLDGEDMTVENGRLDYKDLKEKIMIDEYGDLPEPMRNALIKCDGEFASGSASGQNINAIFTKAYFEHLYKVAKTDKILKKLYEFKVDCINIGTALRARNYQVAKEWFLDDGSLTEKELKRLSEDQLESLKDAFKLTEYKDAVALAVDAKLKGIPLTEFEKFSDNIALKFLRDKGYDLSGRLPYISYCVRKVTEIFNVRVILVGLINGLDKAQIKSRIRDAYER